MGQKQVPVIAGVVGAVLVVGILGYIFLGRGGQPAGTNPYSGGNSPYAPGKGLPPYSTNSKGPYGGGGGGKGAYGQYGGGPYGGAGGGAKSPEAGQGGGE